MFIASLLLLSLAYFWLFRTVEQDNPSIGVIKTKYRWGSAREIHADTNRDGYVDSVAFFRSGLRTISPHDAPLEVWEDRNFNGVYELRAVYTDGELSLVEVDQDEDGRAEQTLHGREAEKLYEARILQSRGQGE